MDLVAPWSYRALAEYFSRACHTESNCKKPYTKDIEGEAYDESEEISYDELRN